ncbi:uncharacterized protein [Halyomorpha halys]|uniref:uncharacterized protein isoform X2 n=1 Tax=Halyomorpha halys TaxID=286706 RepID=UPI0034D28F37
MKILLLIAVFVKQVKWVYMSYDIKNEIIRRLECSFADIDDCPMNGEWSNWGEWGECSGECGQVGLRERFRLCDNPVPLFGGETCIGPSVSTIECRMPGCSVEEYKALTVCDPFRSWEFDVIQKFHEQYPALIERCLIAECHYTLVKSILGDQTNRYWNALHCVKHNNGCPVPGGWSHWGKWSECSAHYGIGKRIRCRTCDSPKPTYFRLNCKGVNCTTEPCHSSQIKEPPHGEWENWSSWSRCTATCGQGLRERRRLCSRYNETVTPLGLENTSAESSYPPQTNQNCPKRIKRNAGQHTFCTGPHTEIEPCYLEPCAVDGEWSEWEPWSQCSSACGVGVETRSRACSSPPVSGGGNTCFGPYTWIRHCYLGPCHVSNHEVTVFSGNGALYYRKTGHATRLLHIFVQIKPLGLNGDIIIRSPTSRPLSKVNVKLSLSAGYLVFLATSGSCHVTLVSRRPIKMYTWLKVLIMATSYGAQMRLDDSEQYFKEPFSCSTKLPNFDSEMTVGGNFSGHIQKLYVNFVHREMKSCSQPVSEEKFTCPSSIANVIFENTEYEEGRDLNDLILVPCSSCTLSTIELVVKTASQDGLLMLIRHAFPTKYLMLSFEPKRVLLRLIINDCIHECFQTIESHVGHWTYIVIDFDQESTWGLAVNGGLRKIVKNHNVNMLISCLDHIMVGDVVEVLHKLEETHKLTINNINIRKISGLLGYIRINKKIIDVHNVPAIVERGNTPLSSETISYTRHYEEIEIIYGQQLNLTCYYGMYGDAKEKNSFSSIYGNEDEPLWIKFDTPLFPSDTRLMDNIGIRYNIIDNGEIIILNIFKYWSREAVEGFYSCWIPSLTNDSIILTYGITVIDLTAGMVFLQAPAW